tara:strand:+ start:1911 stop:3224 length:1314 start_codon:yes stop_codon:yes gene_type:complete
MYPVFALATPPAKSAICIFRVSGDGCHDGLSKIIKNKCFEVGRFHVMDFYNGNRMIDRAGLVAFKGPNSYTGEDSFEVYAHGSFAVMSLFVSLFKSVGFDEAVGGEFTKRAFLNDKISLNEAEALADFVDATDEKGALLSGRSLFGSLSSKLSSFAGKIDQIRVRVEAEIDFSDEGNEYMDKGLIDDLNNLINSFDSFVSGCVNKNKFLQKNKVLLVGPVNSGKSSVFNRLLGFERSIVSNTPGTTRDIISSELFYESNVFSIQDSAGIRDTNNKIESVGIGFSLSQIKKSDLVIGVFEDFDKDLIENFKDLSKNSFFISVQNKIDINKKNSDLFDCCVSAKTGDGFGDFKKLILSSFESGIKKDDYKFMIRDRHNKLFQDVVNNLCSAHKGLKENLSLDLVAEDLRLARSCLDELVGEKFSDSLLGDIFSSYCIGK